MLKTNLLYLSFWPYSLHCSKNSSGLSYFQIYFLYLENYYLLRCQIISCLIISILHLYLSSNLLNYYIPSKVFYPLLVDFLLSLTQIWPFYLHFFDLLFQDWQNLLYLLNVMLIHQEMGTQEKDLYYNSISKVIRIIYYS